MSAMVRMSALSYAFPCGDRQETCFLGRARTVKGQWTEQLEVSGVGVWGGERGRCILRRVWVKRRGSGDCFDSAIREQEYTLREGVLRMKPVVWD